MEIALDPGRRWVSVDGVRYPLHRTRYAPPAWRQKLGDFVRWTGSKSNWASKGILQLFAGGVAFATPANEYVALATTLPDDTTTGVTIVETDYTSYARTQIGTGNNQTDAWNTATGTTTAVVTNKNPINFPAATGASTNPIVGVAITTSGTIGAGNIVYWASVTSTPIAVGDTPVINAGAFSLTED